MPALDALARALERALPAGTVSGPGAAAYARATTPDNTSFVQAPALVVRATSAADVASTVALVRAAGLRIGVQATGHGAGYAVTGDTVLLDTSRLDHVDIDVPRRRARLGAGVTWGTVQAAAEPHGLLGRAGTSPTVGVSGYTFQGGVGWLTRPHGLAAAALHAVEYVDGAGEVRRAGLGDDQGNDQGDDQRDALWAFRGGGPVGVATALEVGLVPVPDLWAGYLFWPADRLPDLLAAWTERLGSVPDALTSTLAVLRLPPEGPFPADLLGRPVVHLSWASTTGEAGLADVRRALHAVAAPAVDTTGPADAARLAQVHLDPPGAVPARATGRWLAGGDPDHLLDVVDAARIGADGGLNMIEIRHVAPAAGASRDTGRDVDGALTRVPGPFLLHAVAAAPDGDARARVDAVLAAVERSAAPIATAFSAPAFRSGRADAGDALPSDVTIRLAAVRRHADPDGVFAFHRVPGDR